MHGEIMRAMIGATALIAVSVMIAMVPSYAQSGAHPPTGQWHVHSDFKGKEARQNLSGAACARTSPALRSCLMVNDQKKYAQFFSVDGATIIPDPNGIIRLSDAEGDPDAEGAAYADGYFYVTGSHGRSRHVNKPNEPSYSVFRFKVNGETGRPDRISGEEVVGIEASDKLRPLIAQNLPAFYNQPLADNGANIEGIAVRGGRVFFGFRGPSDEGAAFILSVAVDGIFGNGTVQPHLERLALGRNTGIRDLASVQGGLLVLSGPVNEQAVTPAVFHWDDASSTLRKLADLILPVSGKAETLLVLDEDTEAYRVLVMLDGPENGAPAEYRIPR
jgi:hypothetical protein